MTTADKTDRLKLRIYEAVRNLKTIILIVVRTWRAVVWKLYLFVVVVWIWYFQRTRLTIFHDWMSMIFVTLRYVSIWVRWPCNVGGKSTHSGIYFIFTLAAGCSTSKSFKIVAPSLVTVTSPTSSTNILSRPTGPKDDFTIFEIDEAAITWNQINVNHLFFLSSHNFCF